MCSHSSPSRLRSPSPPFPPLPLALVPSPKSSFGTRAVLSCWVCTKYQTIMSIVLKSMVMHQRPKASAIRRQPNSLLSSQWPIPRWVPQMCSLWTKFITFSIMNSNMFDAIYYELLRNSDPALLLVGHSGNVCVFVVYIFNCELAT